VKHTATALLLVLFVTALATIPVQANACTVYANPITGEINQVCFGGGDEHCGENCEPPEPPDCEPGTTTINNRFVSNPAAPDTCHLVTSETDTCTGQVIWSSVDYDQSVTCQSNPDEEFPCDEFAWGGGGFTCTRYCDAGWNWDVTASVSFPQIFLDLRPFPATLVRWDTAMRASRLGLSSGVGTLGYAPLGGGSPANPAVGDWRNIRLTLRLVPAANILLVTLPHIGSFSLPVVGESGAPMIFNWEVPSHPEVGGNILAGSVSGFDELPVDMPVFTGDGGGLYRLLWRFQYEQYTRRCVGGSGNGGFECRINRRSVADDGHFEYFWRARNLGGEITPEMVAGLPASMAIDLNGDGTLDFFWNRNLTLRRMDNANSPYNPQWARSWNWGGIIYWGVREGQGQIGWPGNP